MGHFVKSKKSFNAFIDRLVNLNWDECSPTELEQHLNETDTELDYSPKITSNFKLDK